MFKFEKTIYPLQMLENSNYRIELIASKEAWSIRQPVLREGKPIEACIFDGDDFETTAGRVFGFSTTSLLVVVVVVSPSSLRPMRLMKDVSSPGCGGP